MEAVVRFLKSNTSREKSCILTDIEIRFKCISMIKTLWGLTTSDWYCWSLVSWNYESCWKPKCHMERHHTCMQMSVRVHQWVDANACSGIHTIDAHVSLLPMAIIDVATAFKCQGWRPLPNKCLSQWEEICGFSLSVTRDSGGSAWIVNEGQSKS